MAYTYEKQLWKDYPDTSTPITADRLNHMEDGIFEAAKSGGGSADYDSLPVGSVIDYEGDTVPTGYEEVKDTQILWTNPKPTESFASQTITLNDDNYDVLEFYFKSFSSSDEIVSTKALKGHNANLQTMYLDGTKIDIVHRIATYVNDTSYSISNGHIVQAPGTANPFATNTQCIPLYVIGYKTGLFS